MDVCPIPFESTQLSLFRVLPSSVVWFPASGRNRVDSYFDVDMDEGRSPAVTSFELWIDGVLVVIDEYFWITLERYSVRTLVQDPALVSVRFKYDGNDPDYISEAGILVGAYDVTIELGAKILEDIAAGKDVSVTVDL